MSPDLQFVKAHWTNDRALLEMEFLEHLVDVECDNESRVIEEPSPVEVISPAPNGVQYNIKIALMTRTPTTHEKKEHLCKDNIKFLVLKRDKNVLECVGGPYNQEVDGGDWSPSDDGEEINDDLGFRNAAIRHAKEQVNIDLSPVKDWWKFIEISYLRDNGVREVCLVYLISLWDIMPSREDYLVQWEILERAKIERQLTKEHKAKISIEKAKREKVRKDKERLEAQTALDLAAAQPLIEEQMNKEKIEEEEKKEIEVEEKEVTQEEKIGLVKSHFNITANNPTVEELKRHLTETSLSVKGTKQILIDRLYDYVITALAEEEERKKEAEEAERREKEEQERLEKEEKDRLEEERKKKEMEEPLLSLDEELEALFPMPPVVVDLATAPKGTFLYSSTKRVKYQNLKAIVISLDGLLDYDLQDDAEATFEVTLFAENLNDLLMSEFGKTIVDHVTKYGVVESKLRAERELKRRLEREERDRVEAEARKKREEEEAARKEKEAAEAAAKAEAGENAEGEQAEGEKAEGEQAEGEAVQVEGEAAVEQMEVEPEAEVIEIQEDQPEAEVIEIQEEQQEQPAEGEGEQIVVDGEEKPEGEEQQGEKRKRSDTESKDTQKKAKLDNVKKEEPPKEPVVHYDTKLARAFRYFDYLKTGFIRDLDFYEILHCQGLGLTHSQLVQLKLNAWGTDRRLEYGPVVKFSIANP
jgi:hypothetical protein